MDEYQIVELVKDWHRTGSIKAYHNFLLNSTTIISDESYKRSYQHDPSISKQVIGYVGDDRTSSVSYLEFPTLINWNVILFAYLYKKGYLFREISWLGTAPLPNLKYIIYSITSITGITGITGYEFQDRLVIELLDLDVAANNLNLPKIVSSVLGPKLLSENNMIENELYEIIEQIRRKKLFAGHTWYDAELIVSRYFDENKRKLSKEVLKISEAYERVFRPYRIMYDTKTWEQVLV